MLYLAVHYYWSMAKGAFQRHLNFPCLQFYHSKPRTEIPQVHESFTDCSPCFRSLVSSLGLGPGFRSRPSIVPQSLNLENLCTKTRRPAFLLFRLVSHTNQKHLIAEFTICLSCHNFHRFIKKTYSITSSAFHAI